jgi:hypothetical protein
VRHATESDLSRVEGLLVGLRRLSELRERTPGSFYRRSRAFLHFHADADDLYVDVRLDGDDFERAMVTNEAEQADLLSRVQRALGLPETQH